MERSLKNWKCIKKIFFLHIPGINNEKYKKKGTINYNEKNLNIKICDDKRFFITLSLSDVLRSMLTASAVFPEKMYCLHPQKTRDDKGGFWNNNPAVESFWHESAVLNLCFDIIFICHLLEAFFLVFGWHCIYKMIFTKLFKGTVAPDISSSIFGMYEYFWSGLYNKCRYWFLNVHASPLNFYSYF